MIKTQPIQGWSDVQSLVTHRVNFAVLHNTQSYIFMHVTKTININVGSCQKYFCYDKCLDITPICIVSIKYKPFHGLFLLMLSIVLFLYPSFPSILL